MSTYRRFIFDSYALDPHARTIKLGYSLDDTIHFSETFTLPADIELNLNHPDLDRALFALHLSGGASYYKTYCPPEIELRSGHLTTSQAGFWNHLYTYGLGQFFYENGLNFHGLIDFPATATEPAAVANQSSGPAPADKPPRRALVPFGGGKDSVVTTELLRQAGTPQTLFRLRGHHLITELAGIAKLPLLEVGRTLDPELLRLNAAGAFNGHVPITAHISFLTIVVGLLAGFDSVVFSSERSSSYGNVEYLGLEVNHQWSKSLEAELMLRRYIGSHVTRDIAYLNAVRPLSELHIAQIYAKYPQYFGTATSCNRNWVLAGRDPSAARWCGKCPKCAFSFALYAAWLPRETVVAMFGANLFDHADLLPLYRELWGVEGFKPFECVGTPEEAQAAFYLAHQNGSHSGVVITEFVNRVLPTMDDPQTTVQTLLTPDPSTVTPAITPILKQGNLL
jgi:hypothetical protein